MAVKIDFVAEAKAPTLDDIDASLKNKSLVSTENTRKALELALSKHLLGGIEQFNFGPLHEKTLLEAQSESMDFVEHGLFSLPYPLCFYRANVFHPHENMVVGESYLVLDGDDRHKGIAVVQILKSATHMVALTSNNTMERVSNPQNGEGCIVKLSKEEHEFWSGTLRGPHDELASDRHIAEGSMTMLGLTMILNTKGVRKERVAPPTKPNLVRARKGRILLPYVTHVHTDVYNRAVEPGQGTHASPRPHRRRAHVRTYLNEDGSVKDRVPIAAMLVNWDGRPLQRGEYEVSK
jgi:hypothetical protein